MPVDFLSDEQKNRYGRFAGDPCPMQLARCFHLDDADRALIDQRRREHNRLGFAVQLGTVRFLGTFLHTGDVPKIVVDYVARQLDIRPSLLRHYAERPITQHEHADLIREVCGYQSFNTQPGHFRLVRWLFARSWVSSERPSLLFDAATSWLVERKILLPGVTTLSRLIARVRDRAAARAFRILGGAPTMAQRGQLEQLLTIPKGDRHSHLDRLRQGPRRVSGPALVGALNRLEEVRQIRVGHVLLDRVPPSRVKALERYAAAAWAPTIARMSEDRRIATLLAFVKALEARALDDSLDLFDALVTQIVAQAERLWKKERLRTLRDLDAAALTLRQACALLLDESLDSSQLRQQIFARVPEEDLRKAVSAVESLARPAEDRHKKEIIDRYRRVRYFLPCLLESICFSATAAGRPVLRALEFLRTLERKPRPDLSNAPLEAVPSAWRSLVLTNGERIDRRAYTLCVLQRLQDALRRRDVFVEGSERWGDPRAKLIDGETWRVSRSQICQSLSLETTPTKQLTALQELLDNAYRETAERLPENDAVRVDSVNGADRLVVTPLDKLTETSSLGALRGAVMALLPRVDLPEALLEIHVRTGFANELTHVSESESRIADLAVSACAVLVAEACNIGLEPLVRRDVPALTRGRLTWVQQNYMRAETLAGANARLVDAQSDLPLAQIWGGGEVASADGLRFVTPLRTINAGPNSKYFGRGRGITYYNYTSDQFTGFHGIVVPGTLRDSMFILEGLLEQQTSLRPTEIMTDTAGVSDVVFGLFWLLGFQFSPRLADLGAARFWRIDTAADYGLLNHISRHRVSTERIAANWDDMLRVAGSLKMGTVRASELIRSLLRSDKPSTLTRAIVDLGRITKTLYLLAYIDDEAYRRRVLTQLNRQEARHSLARAVFHGRRGEVRQRYREGQEDQLSSLGLVVNVLVLWNTIYMNAAVEHLRATGEVEVLDEDLARLSPLEHRNINFLGQYSFALSETVARGQLRPLRDPEEEYGPVALA